MYVSGTGVVRSADELAGCSGKDAKEDPNTSLFSIDVIQIPLAAPRNRASSVSRASSPIPRPARSPACGRAATTARERRLSRITRSCHDITVFPEIGLAAGACSGNGILLDIADPVHPVRLDAVTDKSFAFWHSATFSNDGIASHLHRRMGRRHSSALPFDGSCNLGRQRGFRHRRSQDAVCGLLQDAGAAERTGKLRRTQRLAHSGTRARHHGAGVVSGRYFGIRLHRSRLIPWRSRSSIAGRSTRRI